MVALTKAIKYYVAVLGELQYGSMAVSIRDHNLFMTAGICKIHKLPNAVPVFLGIYSKLELLEISDPTRFNPLHYKDALHIQVDGHSPIRYYGATMSEWEHNTLYSLR